MDINTDPGMILGHRQGSDVTMAPGSNAGHLVQHDPHNSVALKHQQDPGGSPDPWSQHGL